MATAETPAAATIATTGLSGGPLFAGVTHPRSSTGGAMRPASEPGSSDALVSHFTGLSRVAVEPHS